MKALSIKQPFASLICTPRYDNPLLGIKDIENRTWKTNFRGRIYIHASAKGYSNNVELFNWEQAKSYWNKREQVIELSKLKSAIIGEVDIVDCVINHSSIWAEKSEFQCCGIFPTNDCSPCGHFKSEKSKRKIIYNWVLANPVLYEKPILNVKGKLSFWEPDIDIVECIGCSGKFDYEIMQQDDAGEDYCPECAAEMFPVMRAEYQELLRKGEID